MLTSVQHNQAVGEMKMLKSRDGTGSDEGVASGNNRTSLYAWVFCKEEDARGALTMKHSSRAGSASAGGGRGSLLLVLARLAGDLKSCGNTERSVWR